MCFVVTQFILEQQELKLKKNSKSRKKRKQNTEEEEGTFFLFMSLSVQHITFGTVFPTWSWLSLGQGGGISLGRSLKYVFLLSLKHVWSLSRANHYKSNISLPAERPL